MPYVKVHGNRSSGLGCRVETNKQTDKRELTVQWTATAAKVKGHRPYFLVIVPIELDKRSIGFIMLRCTI